MATITPQARAATGIAGLDDILGGGLPAHHLYLVEGTPGTGKTTLGLQFLLEGVRLGEPGLYITLSETAEELAIVAQSHGWSLDGLEVFELVGGPGLGYEAEQSILHPAEIELGETIQGVMRAVERCKPARVVFDSLSEMRLLAQNPLRYRRQVLALKRFFAERACTVMMLDDRSAADTDTQLASIAHGVLSMEQSFDQYGPSRRRLLVLKMRGIAYRGGEHDFKLGTGGLIVYPRLVAAEHRGHTETAVCSSGTPALDALLGGGLCRGSNLLFIGPSGVGKTTTAMSCVRAALARGEQAQYYLFDEGVPTLLHRCRALGLDLGGFIDEGQLAIEALDPAAISPGEFAHHVRCAVEQRQARVVVIDSLNAYLQAMPGSKHLMLQMHELLTYLNQRDVVGIVILGQHGVLGEGSRDVDLSYLSDSIVLFRYFESRGRLLKAVSVVKSRTQAHELTIREFRLGAGGLEVGQSLTDFEGVLTGTAVYEGRHPMLADGDGHARPTAVARQRA